MKERPILFSAPMARAILADTKTQTRRVANKTVRHPDLGNLYTPGALVTEREPQHVIERACPYGQPGDRLWVRETFYAWGRWETRYSAKKGRDEWHFVDMTLECGKAYQYPASGGQPQPQPMAGKRDGGVTPKWWKRPAIHMPRAASRITLEIVSVRVERLQDISEEDSRAEGVEWLDHAPACPANNPAQGWRGYTNHEPLYRDTARESFISLWQSINGTESWAANPWVWVWVVEFKKRED
ncbi:hypothetical protein OU995_11700 [Roseateles sp. SL47]|uniref:hypothetical protein n=1 Tax=Roseateles sp. SL47 TaxID=2995138 RepID=UPI00226E7FDE|nr:hypothetical protein [Roseateles sp. SL47]WAC75312.1 hypothetical protein OU995_11700 [Roseateles sp. SL47]